MASVNTSKVTASSLLVTLGIIYGDIGTSPLYVMKAICNNKPISEQLILGSLSCIIWTLIILTTIKYVWITLQADNQGEGGIFSLLSLVRKYKKKLAILTMIGAATLLADGFITPAISVTSAVEGLQQIPSLSHIPLIPIIIVIISGIFFAQQLGTQKVGAAYGPIMVVWFSVLFISGIYQISNFPEVYKAINPIYAIDFLQNYPNSFWLLGAIFLCTTGAEAMYSDLGHCGKKNIRITWSFVKIALIINYLGQGAWLLQHHSGEQITVNPFFSIVPEQVLLPYIILATLAAFIASQALITGSFTLINEAINLNFWIKVAVKQPSEEKGQVYIPSINFILWIGCITLVLIFQNSGAMESVYGLAIALSMIVTTLMLYFYLKHNKKWNKFLVLSIISIFFIVEGTYLIANSSKFMEGGYVMIIISGIFFAVMFFTYYGRKLNNKYIRFVKLSAYIDQMKQLRDDTNLDFYATNVVYLSKANSNQDVELNIMKSLFNKGPKRANIYWFIHINRTHQPYTLTYELTPIADKFIYKIDINVGFRQAIKTEVYFKQILQNISCDLDLEHQKNINPALKYYDDLDFKFIILEKYLSKDNNLSWKENLILKSYYMLRKLGINDIRAFGLDQSDVDLEYIPFTLTPLKINNLTRV